MTKVVYDKLTSNKDSLRKLCAKWEDKLGEPLIYSEFLENFQNIYNLTSSTKLRNFQFRFLHRVIFCGERLYKWKLIDSPLCQYCRLDYETPEHIFYSCNIVKRFWEMFTAWFECLQDIEINLSQQNIYFCNYDNDDLLNTLLLIAKQYIFYAKTIDREPNVYIFKERVMEIIRIERFSALQQGKYKKFVKKWKRMFPNVD